jgi:hypothetical protein
VLEAAGGHDHLAGGDRAVARLNGVAVAVGADARGLHAGADRQSLVLGVGLEVVTHLPSARESVAGSVHRHSRQGVVLGRAVEPE